jgi:hypothetical protein
MRLHNTACVFDGGARLGANRLAQHQAESHASCMFMVNEAEAAAIRQAYEEGGEFAAAIELRRYFPGIRDNANARLCARTIASWTTLPPIVKRRSARKQRKAAAA